MLTAFCYKKKVSNLLVKCNKKLQKLSSSLCSSFWNANFYAFIFTRVFHLIIKKEAITSDIICVIEERLVNLLQDNKKKNDTLQNFPSLNVTHTPFFVVVGQ